MKNYNLNLLRYTSFFVLLFTIPVFSQQQNEVNQEKINPLVKDFYGDVEYSRLLHDNPNLVLYKHCLITYAYRVVDIGEKAKSEKYPLLDNVKKECKNSISENNYLCFELSLKEHQQVFIIEGSKALIVISKDELLKKYNSLLRKL